MSLEEDFAYLLKACATTLAINTKPMNVGTTMIVVCTRMRENGEKPDIWKRSVECLGEKRGEMKVEGPTLETLDTSKKT